MEYGIDNALSFFSQKMKVTVTKALLMLDSIPKLCQDRKFKAKSPEIEEDWMQHTRSNDQYVEQNFV